MMEGTYSYEQGYTPWNPTPYQHHSPQYNVYQSNGFGDAYYGYKDPLPPYPPSQGNFEDIFQVLLQERKEFWETQKRLEARLATVTELVTRLVTPSVASTLITSQPLNSGDLPSQALSIPRRSIPTLFLCANQEGREDAPLNEEDVENLNHEEVRECLEEVEEKSEDQEAEDVDHEVENKDKEKKGIEIVHSASSKATPCKLPSELQFEWKEDSTELGSEFKAYSGYLHKFHNNRANVGALSSKKHLGPWQFQEKLVDSQNNGWTNQVWDPGKSYKMSRLLEAWCMQLGILEANVTTRIGGDSKRNLSINPLDEAKQFNNCVRTPPTLQRCVRTMIITSRISILPKWCMASKGKSVARQPSTRTCGASSRRQPSQEAERYETPIQAERVELVIERKVLHERVINFWGKRDTFREHIARQ
ncbi:hypothetical protein PIB30_032175 [Stylosanthes scabra]|uniref:Uncharacterized protein n=1 Tax=Stylosanthes scabra TaxID=79078 RepID=A0ABU6QBQ2_9FABA|nr:hypothetical protein [Stylosanthes scabra]